MDESIFTEIKRMLGINDPSYTAFDDELLPLVNSSLADLALIGVGPKGGLSIITKNEKWSDLIDNDSTLQNVKEYIYIDVKLVWDPPQNSFLVNSLEKKLDKLEWHLNIAADKESSNV